MPVVKKRRSHHAKSSRAHQIQLQQQQQLQAKQRFENSRLRPEHMSTVAHDESDTISYRSYLLKHFRKSAELIDVLTAQLVPLDKIRAPAIYPKTTLSEMERKLETQKDSLARIKKTANDYEWKFSENSRFLKDKLRLSEQELEEPDKILKEYEAKFGLRSQDNRIVFYRDEFLHLNDNSSEAPNDYWQNHTRLKGEHEERQRQKRLEEEQEAQKRLQEEQELNLRAKEEDENRKKVLEEQQRQEKEQRERELRVQEQQEQEAQQQQQQSREEENQEQAHMSQESQQQQTSNPNMMDSMFGDFGSEPFNNGFEDEFGDIDTAFF